MDNFPEELREVVNDHWTQFPPQHPFIIQAFGIFFLILTVLCLIGNLLLVYVFLTTPKLKVPVRNTNLLIENLI